MGVVSRFGVSLEETLLQHFDRLIRRKGYTNRSEALRDLIRESLVREHHKAVTDRRADPPVDPERPSAVLRRFGMSVSHAAEAVSLPPSAWD